MTGFHDDLIMAFAIGSFVREKVYVMALELQQYIESKPALMTHEKNQYSIFTQVNDAYDETGRQRQTDDIFDSIKDKPVR